MENGGVLLVKILQKSCLIDMLKSIRNLVKIAIKMAKKTCLKLKIIFFSFVKVEPRINALAI